MLGILETVLWITSFILVIINDFDVSPLMICILYVGLIVHCIKDLSIKLI